MSLEQENFDGLERAFRDKFKDWEVPPPPGAWNAISGKVSQQKRPLANLKLLAPLVLLLFMGSIYLYLSQQEMEGQPSPLALEQETKTETSATIPSDERLTADADLDVAIKKESSGNHPSSLADGQNQEAEVLNEQVRSGSAAASEAKAKDVVASNSSNANIAVQSSDRASVVELPKKTSIKPVITGRQSDALSNKTKQASSMLAIESSSDLNASDVTETNVVSSSSIKSANGAKGVKVNRSKSKASASAYPASARTLAEIELPVAIASSEQSTKDQKVTSQSEPPSTTGQDVQNVVSNKVAEVSTTDSDNTKQSINELPKQELKAEQKELKKEEPKLVAETKGKAEQNGSVWAVDAYLMPRFTFRKVVASSASDLHIRQMESRSPLAADRIGFEIGGRVARQFGKLFELNTGFHFANINEELTFKAEEGTPSWHQIHQNPDGTVSLNPMYRSGSITQKSSFYYGGLNLGASVYLNKSQRLRISSGAGVNWLMRGYTTRTFEGEQIANYSFPSITAPFEQINMHLYGGFAYLHPISSRMTFIFEPTVNFFLFSTYQSREPVTVTPTTMGANFMLRYKL